MTIINIKDVLAVLLPDGTWHNVHEGSFSLEESCQFTGFGQGKDRRIFERAATWTEQREGERYACPVSSIVAVRYKEVKQPTTNC
jgi:hypothetical protein